MKAGSAGEKMVRDDRDWRRGVSEIRLRVRAMERKPESERIRAASRRILEGSGEEREKREKKEEDEEKSGCHFFELICCRQ